MKKNYLSLAIWVGLVFASCSLKRNVTTDKSIHSPRLEVTESKLYVKPVVADLKITPEKKSVEFSADLKIPLSEIQNNALNLFLTTYNCDYVIDPVYTQVTTIENSKLNSITLKVTGFPATYEKLYQVESLPNSIVQSSQINLPVKRVEFINEIKENTTGGILGFEFVPVGSMLFQLDYSKSQSGLHYYFSADYGNLQSPKEMEFTASLPNYSDRNYTVSSQQYRNYSFGLFGNKEISNHLICRASLGFNSTNSLFDNSIYFDEAQFIGIRNYGFRFGVGVQYEILNGIYIISRANSDLSLTNGIVQNGTLKSTISNVNVPNNSMLRIGYGVGLRFEF